MPGFSLAQFPRLSGRITRSCGSQWGCLMTDTRIESIRKALGLTEEARERNARHSLDGALIEIERNGGRADTDCLQTVKSAQQMLARPVMP
jgi:hypothetical protein